MKGYLNKNDLRIVEYLPRPPAQITLLPTTPMAKSPRLVGMFTPIFHCAVRNNICICIIYVASGEKNKMIKNTNIGHFI